MLGSGARRYFALVGLVLLIAVSSQISNGFLTLGNARNILTTNAPIGFICIGMTFIIIGGSFDLSVGGTYALGAVVGALVANHMGTTTGIALVLAVGVTAGAVNGLLVGVLRMNSFIVTLGTGSVFSALAYIVSRDQSIQVTTSGFGALGHGTWIGVPVLIWLLIGMFVLGWAVLHFSVYGYNLYAIGGNPEAAHLAGIRVEAIRASTFVLVGALAALGGLAFTSELGVGQADVGSTVALDAIAIVVIGGSAMLGGEGGVGRTAIGFLLIAVLVDLFDLLALNSSIQLLVKGAVLVIAVSLDTSALQAWRARIL
ncbi:MAG: ABC transporter permease, partial [Actinobacteria bacterium]|nr:ABC transporter permease [Actinomycetota bacterium]